MSGTEQQIDAVRRFNRFYTRQLGLLNEGLLDSSFSLAESRVLYELAHRDRPAAAELVRDLGMDAGYVSRILRGFKKRGLVENKASKEDGRQSLLSLTRRGRSEAAALNEGSQQQISAILKGLPNGGRERLIQAMGTVQTVLSGQPQPKQNYVVREHGPGDLGWIVSIHGWLYAREYGWNQEFEAFVAEIAAEFLNNYDPKWERCWMAEVGGKVVGSVALVKESKKVAKLRLLIVDPEARGLGIGAALVGECIRFAKETGYRRITLMTNRVLDAARRIYENAGFKMVAEEPRKAFGKEHVFETWELRLG